MHRALHCFSKSSNMWTIHDLYLPVKWPNMVIHERCDRVVSERALANLAAWLRRIIRDGLAWFGAIKQFGWSLRDFLNTFSCINGMFWRDLICMTNLVHCFMAWCDPHTKGPLDGLLQPSFMAYVMTPVFSAPNWLKSERIFSTCASPCHWK